MNWLGELESCKFVESAGVDGHALNYDASML